MESTITVDVVVLPGRCWRCGEVTYPIAGVLVAGTFREFDEVSSHLQSALAADALAAIGTGAIARRTSRRCPSGDLSNGCLHCDAIQGNVPLHEDVVAFVADGGDLRDLSVGPVAIVATM